MKKHIWVWNYSDYATLGAFICTTIGLENIAVVRSDGLLHEEYPNEFVGRVDVLKEGYETTLIEESNALDKIIRLDAWSIEVVLFPPSPGIDSINQWIRNFSFPDSRGISIDCLTPEALEVIDSWGYSIWLSFGAIDARRRCLIRSTNDEVSNTLENAITSMPGYLGHDNSTMPASLKDGQVVEQDDVRSR